MILDESMGENILFHIDQISILSYNTVAEIVSKIKSFLIQIPSENNKEVMKYLDYAYYFKYSVTSHFRDNDYIEFNDPLYILDFIRNKDITEKSILEIQGKINSKKELSFEFDYIQINRKGFGKFFNFDGKFCGWREIKEKKCKGVKKSYFTCLDEKCKILLN